MAITGKQDEQSEPWPVNGRRPAGAGRAFVSPIESSTTVEATSAAAGSSPDAATLIEASAIVDAAAAREAPRPAFPTFSATPPPEPAFDERARQAEMSGNAYPPDNYDDTVLGGLSYQWAAPRQPVGDARWAASLRSFARGAIWCLPVAVIAWAIASIWGWPTPGAEPRGASPGTWMLVSLLGFGLWLAGVIAVAALLAATPVRPWGFVAVISTIGGVVLFAPVVGVLGLARPAISRASAVIGEPAPQLQSQLLDGAVGRWLVIGGGTGLAVGALALAGAILGARVLNRIDGWLIAAAVGVSVVAAYLSWEFLLTLAAMVLLAGTLGLAWTASRISADGAAPPAY